MQGIVESGNFDPKSGFSDNQTTSNTRSANKPARQSLQEEHVHSDITIA